jgi:WhiB family redox-sensing transcriptional regulator
MTSPETWRESALCAQTDPEVFFPSVGGGGGAARRICRRCPVQTECLEVALARPAEGDVGIWGGTSARERRALRAERTTTPPITRGSVA